MAGACPQVTAKKPRRIVLTGVSRGLGLALAAG